MHCPAGLTTQLIDKLGTANYTYDKQDECINIVSTTCCKQVCEYNLANGLTKENQPPL